MTSIYNFLRQGQLPPDDNEAARLQAKAKQYTHENDIL